MLPLQQGWVKIQSSLRGKLCARGTGLGGNPSRKPLPVIDIEDRYLMHLNQINIFQINTFNSFIFQSYGGALGKTFSSVCNKMLKILCN